MGRAGGLAGGSPCFTNGKAAGYGLWVFFVNGFTYGKALIIFIGDFYGAYFCAFPATGAF